MRFATAIVIVLICLPALGSAAQEPEENEEALEQRIRTLEDRIESLEQMVLDLSHQLSQVQQARVPVLDKRPPGIPPDAMEGEFNGLRYYLVPLDRPGEEAGPKR